MGEAQKPVRTESEIIAETEAKIVAWLRADGGANCNYYADVIQSGAYKEIENGD